jgi:sugar (pentulose or hexulose) kinase
VGTEVVAVLDVGKTNKKLAVYDRDFNVLDEERTTLETKDHNGLEVESSEELVAWLKGSLKSLASKFTIRSVAITAHGATYVLLDGQGKLAHPVISYTCPKGADVQEEFYQQYGNRDSLHRLTCSPDLGFANLAKSMYYVKTRLPEAWANCRHALFYSSYLAYELTGEMGRECTYLGNHSYLWDFHQSTWSPVGLDLSADKLFPAELSAPWDCLGVVKPDLAQECGLPADCKVTMGIHDSNANFLPYLAKGYENFMLNSTGTWCVVMKQSTSPDLTDEEVAAKVFCNLDSFNNPLKTSIFPAGMEYDTFRGFTDLKDEGDLDAVKSVVAKQELLVIPGVLPDATAFPGATARVVNGGTAHPLAALEADGGKPMTPLGQEYYGALNLSLALATRQTLKRCGARQGTTVFVEGGFANNRVYCALLATLCPENTIALTNVKEGTSFGAALTGWMVAEECSLQRLGEDFEIETTEVAPCDVGDLVTYEQKFEALLKE